MRLGLHRPANHEKKFSRCVLTGLLDNSQGQPDHSGAIRLIPGFYKLLEILQLLTGQQKNFQRERIPPSKAEQNRNKADFGHLPCRSQYWIRPPAS